MNIPAMGGDAIFDISGDFNDALSVIAATDPDYANKTNNNNNKNNSNNNANVQPRQRISSQCLVEEQQQRRRAAQQSQTVAHHQMLQAAYQQQFQNKHPQYLSQQQQQQLQQHLLAYQRQNQLSQAQKQAAQVCQTVPRVQNQPTQVCQIMPQAQNQATQVRQAAPQIQNQATQVHRAAPPIQNHATQVHRAAPQIQNQATQVHRAAPPIQNHATQMRQATPPIQNQAAQARQVVPQMQNQIARVRQTAPQVQAQARQFQQSQAHQQNGYQQPQLQNQQAQQPMTQKQQQLLAAYQQFYASSPQVQNQQQQQQQHPRNFAPQATSPVCSSQNAYPMMPQQRQANPQTNIQPKLPVVQQTVPKRSMQIPKSKPYVEIVEQPAARGARFRYGCEVRSSGSIPGVNSTPDKKTYPTIRVVGYNGEAVVVVSCVTRDEPYRAHPHNLVGKVLCKNGVCKAKMSKDNMTMSFDKIGIQCIKKKDVFNSLSQREKIQVDPFNNGFDDKHEPASFDQSCVRLAFQVYLQEPTKGQYKLLLPPVVSDPIYDKKSSPDLVIYKLSHCTAPATGGNEDMIILCDKVTEEDIQVRFYEERDDEIVWEGFGELNTMNAVHKHVAIICRSPKYIMTDLNRGTHIYVELVRPSDGIHSNPLPFMFTFPNHSSEVQKKRKRMHETLITNSFLMKNLEATTQADQWNIVNQPNFNIIEAR